MKFILHKEIEQYTVMGTIREVTHRKSKIASSLDIPVWLGQAESLPNRDFITPSEKRLIDLVRKHGDFTKADLAVYTDFSRTKITNCIDSLLNKEIIVTNKD